MKWEGSDEHEELLRVCGIQKKMISLNNVGSAGQALHYFSKENYYTKQDGLAHSEWFGKGAIRLDLAG